MWAKFGSYKMIAQQKTRLLQHRRVHWFTGHKSLPNASFCCKHGPWHRTWVQPFHSGNVYRDTVVFPFGARPRRKKARFLGKNLQAAGIGRHHHRQHLQAAKHRLLRRAPVQTVGLGSLGASSHLRNECCKILANLGPQIFPRCTQIY